MCRAQGIPAPEFSSSRHRFDTLFSAGAHGEESLRKRVLNERQIRALRWIGEKGSISNREYRELVGVSNKTAFLELNAMVQEGILETRGSARSLRYAPKVTMK